jgi:hypothetical protein
MKSNNNNNSNIINSSVNSEDIIYVNQNKIADMMKSIVKDGRIK